MSKQMREVYRAIVLLIVFLVIAMAFVVKFA